MKSPKYFFQLTADDIAKMKAAGNIRAGRGIIITPTDSGLEVKIDEKAMVDFIWCFVSAGMVREGLSGVPCTVPYTVKNTRDTVSLDPMRYA